MESTAGSARRKRGRRRRRDYREARIPQTWIVGDVDHCVNELAAFIREYGLTDIVTWAVPPGHAAGTNEPQPGRFTRDVAPRVKAAAAAA